MLARAVQLVVLGWSCVCVGTASAETPAQLLRWVPADANAIAIIDAVALYRSPLAMRENWRQKAAEAFVNRELSVPPEAKRVTFASQLSLSDQLQSVWELGLIEVEHTPSFALMARRDGGELDTLAGHAALRLPRGAYAVELAPGLVLGTAQTSRQVVSRWVGSAKNDSAPRVAPYLKQAAEQFGSSGQVLMAIDLSDYVTAHAARAFLTRFEPLKNKTAEQADLAELLATVKGLTITVKVTDKREGTVRIDFGKPTADLKPYALRLISEVLNLLEAGVPDLDDWSAAASGTSVTLTGECSPGSLRNLISLIAPSPSHSDLPYEPMQTTVTPTPSPEAAKAATSQKYFRSVKGLIDELRETLHKTRDNHAVWMERSARKIDDLPIKDVDKDLLTFGGNVSNSFRYQAQAKRMAGVRSGVREAQPNYQTYSSYGGLGPYGSYGTYSWSTTVRVEPERNQIRTEENANATQTRISEWKQIEDGLVQIRRVMTERYNTEF